MSDNITGLTEERIFQKIQNVLADYLGVASEEIKHESNIVEDLGADSLDLVEFVMAMEEEFEVEISDDEAEKVKTVADAVAALQRLLGNRAAS